MIELFLIIIFTFASMFRRNTTKQFFSTFISALYLFVVLFSQDLHSHENFSEFKDASSISSEKNSAHAQSESDSGNCLSCHFLYTGNSFFPQEFTFDYRLIDLVKEKIAAFDAQFVQIAIPSLYLRGPPNELI